MRWQRVGKVGLPLVFSAALAAGAAAQGTLRADEPIWDQVTRRVSVDSTGGELDGNSERWGNQALSHDGRYVVFRSYASNIVPGDTNGVPDIFVHDRLTSEITRVNVSSDGQQANGGFSGNSCISADGRFVAFDSYATNLVSGDTNGEADVFVHDRVTGETTRVSVGSSGREGNKFSGRPALSADGRFVAFKSLADNLVPGDTNNRLDVFVHDRLTGETTRVSVSSDGTEGDRGSSEFFGPAISRDGRYVAFPSDATNLVPGDTNGKMDLFVHDRVTRETTRVSVSSSGTEANGASWYPSMSEDGRYVAFVSVASNLVQGDTNRVLDVFVHDRLTGETTLVSVSSDGAQGWYDSRDPDISADGRYVTFTSPSDLSPGSGPGADIFVHDCVRKQTTCASVSYSGILGFYFRDNIYPSISGDGRHVAFDGGGPGLVPGDTNRKRDVFVRGPEITLEADPTAAGPGQTLVLTVYKGVPGHPALLWVVGINGLPTSVLIEAGTFGPDGDFVVSGQVPPGLAGEQFTFRGQGLGCQHLRVRTNDVMVSFQ